MQRFLLAAATTSFLACVLACGGGGETAPGPARAEKPKAEQRKPSAHDRRDERLAAALKLGDKVRVDVPSDSVICGADLDSLCYFAGQQLTWDYNPQAEDLKPDAKPAYRKLAEMHRDGKLVPVKNGAVGEVVAEPGTKNIDRAAIKMPNTDLKWVKVRFDKQTVFAPVTALEKQ